MLLLFNFSFKLRKIYFLLLLFQLPNKINHTNFLQKTHLKQEDISMTNSSPSVLHKSYDSN